MAALIYLINLAYYVNYALAVFFYRLLRLTDSRLKTPTSLNITRAK